MESLRSPICMLPVETQESRETPYGTLYRPRPVPVQIAVLFAAFFMSASLGWIPNQILGGLSKNAQALVHIPFFLVFLAGYALWLARVQAIVFGMLGVGIIRALWQMLVRKKKPGSLEEVLPSREKLEELVVRVQRAGSSFLLAAIPIAAIAALAGMLMRSTSSSFLGATVLGGGTLLWGYLLSVLAQRGYLPIPEDQN